MNTVIIATDFSENARQAARFAFHVFPKESSHFIFLHAYQMPHTTAGTLISTVDVLKKVSEEDLMKEVIWAKSSFGETLSVSQQSYFGELTEALRHTNNGKAIAVVGSTGTSELEEFFLGSTTETVIKNAEIPTIAVPHVFEEKPYKKMVVAIEDFAALQEKTKHSLHQIALFLNLEMEMVTIQTTEAEMEQVLEGNTAPEVTEFMDGITVNHRFLISEEIEDGLWQATKNQNADMLCVVHHKKGMLQDLFRKSISKEMVKDDLMPVLVLHE